MNNETIIFETGSTDCYVNELILYTDTTKSLCEIRDNIYKERTVNKKGKIMDFKEINPINFKPLWEAAVYSYRWEFKDYKKWAKMEYMSNRQIGEYCRLYAKDFQNWKKEHGFIFNTKYENS